EVASILSRFQTARDAVELPLVGEFDSQMRQHGDARIDQIRLLLEFAALGAFAADDEKAVKDLRHPVTAAVTGSLAAMIAGDDDEPIFLVASGALVERGQNVAHMLSDALDRRDILGHTWMKAMLVACFVDLAEVEKQTI